MKTQRFFFVIVLSALVCAAAASWRRQEAAPQPPPGARAREDAYRANNLGVALLEQFKHAEGAQAFRRALGIDPKLTLARINLAVALYNLPDLAGARAEAQRAAAEAPDAPQPHYLLGLVARQQNSADEAAEAFRRVLKFDPRDVGANVNLGQLYAQQRRYAEAIAAFRVALAEEPYNGTALYNLGTALLRSGEREEGQRLVQQFQVLRESGAATIIGQNYLEQGRYAEAVASTGAEPDLVSKAAPEVVFADATAAALSSSQRAAARPKETSRASGPVLGETFKAADLDAARLHVERGLAGAALLFDFDDDGDLDLFETAGDARRLLRNDAGKFADVTAQSGALKGEAGKPVFGAAAGDYDNDGRQDLLLLEKAQIALYKNDGGGGRFSKPLTFGHAHTYASAAFLDADHDGDLDIFAAGLADLSKLPARPAAGGAGGAFNFPSDFAPAQNLLLRNNGDGTFADVTARAKVEGGGRAVALVPTDFDNRRDVDLLVVNHGAPPRLYRNLRDGTFRDVAAEVGLDFKGDFTCAAAGDVNKDDFTDFFFGASGASGVFAMSDGRGRFVSGPAPAATAGAKGAQFFDYDNDGLLDLILATRAGLRVLRNVGADWADVSTRAAGRGFASQGLGRTLASGDVDGDGDTDLFLRASVGGLKYARNDGGSRNPSVRVRLAGKVSNRTGVGSKIEVRAGSLRQKIETYSATPAPAPADVLFGLGRRERADAVRVLWPSGVVQSETEFAQGAAAARKPPNASVTLPVTELDRKPSSCPFLYAWDGERFGFVTDFMGGGEMGGLVAPGVFNTPDPDEYVRIRGDQLKPLNGRYELRVTNELEEALFVDRLQLVAVAHPRGVEVYPDEGLRDAPPAFKLYTTRGARPPAAATDGHGHDVLARVSRLDRMFADDFRVGPVRGYAEPHDLTLDLGELDAKGRTLLLLTGWTDYAFSSDNVAASQSDLKMRPPALQVRDRQGKWTTVVENMGFPVGRPQTVVVDLTGKFLSASREVRVVTNMRVYWDQILVDTSGADSPLRVTRLDAGRAELRWRGFSAEVSPDGREPFGYDYARVSAASPWKAFPGRYTREGDVRELLSKTDDMFVVSRAGDEVSLSFDASALPALPEGWTRTFLLYADGFSKEMNIHSSSPDVLAPLPFHGMKSYPYGARDARPLTPGRLDYVERYNTRVVARPLPTLVAGH